MTEISRVEGHPSLRKKDGSIVNTNADEYEKAKALRKSANDVKQLTARIVTLEKSLGKIIELLEEIQNGNQQNQEQD